MPDDLTARARKRAKDFREARYMNDAGRIFLCEASQSDADLLTALADRVDEQERRIKELERGCRTAIAAIEVATRMGIVKPDGLSGVSELLTEALSQKGGE